MAITSLLELTLKPEAVADAPRVIAETLVATRAFDGFLGVDVLVDATDPTHVVLVETWESLEHDSAYRVWRSTPDGASQLGSVLASPPVLTKLTPLEGF
ncbi:antibiotic biosynthesis monooxygenase [Kineococcus sp. R8]|uniref:putative quinol monooxygenase n=1 Tax=Kineococcus siccus TaxID=2696567 RepID=UPI00141282BA|nr:antibiotic biosynthesis monooxygenase family protein [Kineococcus siccus]NAZ80306.1 antibiotic biosynthesis monooxygenase [Kineococcus siccus]